MLYFISKILLCVHLLSEKCLSAAKYILLPNREGDTLQRGPFEDTIYVNEEAMILLLVTLSLLN